ncbi:MAG TPA: hypothetical protein VNG71_09940 [Pyrinomonadaceae bacterium]|nr:hypothetical protein [Pyrinomonadaceae bacterium]
MADSWGKVYVFNATGENVAAYFNEPAKNHFVVLRNRSNSAPYLPSSVPVPRGPDNENPGTFWNSTSARFEDEAGAWVASYNAIEVPAANKENHPVSIADDLVLYVFRDCVVLYDTHGFTLETSQASSYNERGMNDEVEELML